MKTRLHLPKTRVLSVFVTVLILSLSTSLQSFSQEKKIPRYEEGALQENTTLPMQRINNIDDIKTVAPALLPNKDIKVTRLLPETIQKSTTLINAENAVSYTLTDDDVTVNNSGYITACSYDFTQNTNGTALIIPDTLCGQAIIGISDAGSTSHYGIFTLENITSVELPSTLESIGINAFYGTLIEELTTPNSVTHIEAQAFYNVPLNNLTLSSNIQFVGNDAFLANDNLTNIILPTFTTNGFDGWKDGNGNKVALAGNEYVISDFSLSYTAIFLPVLYELTCNDVAVDNTGYITGCYYDFTQNPHGTALVIPDTLCGQAIKGISDAESTGHYGIFTFCDIMSVELPSTLEHIGINAFYGTEIEELTIPSNVTRIESQAFCQCQLRSVTLSSNIVFIGQYAFYSNTDLDSIVLPTLDISGFDGWKGNGNRVTLIGNEYMINDFSLSYTAIFPPSSYELTCNDVSIDGRGYITDCSYDFTQNIGGTNLTIPNTLCGESIVGVEVAIFNEKNLTAVNLPSSLEHIESIAFSNNLLTEVNLPDGVISIGYNSFSNNKIDSLIIPNSVENIEKGAFRSNLLTEIDLPTNLTRIENSSFSNNRLESIIIPNSVTEIGTYAFSYNQLAEISLPDGLISIGESAFTNNKIETLIIPNSVEEIKLKAFSNNSISELTLSSNLNSIYTEAFSSNKIHELIIPASLTNIGSFAFSGDSLISVIFEEQSKLYYIHDDAFDGQDNLPSITLPSHAETSGFSGWTNGNDSVIGAPYTISDYSTSYTAKIPYTLTCDDVTLDENGYIASCSHIAGSQLTIPETLCGTAIKGIVGENAFTRMPFYQKGIIEVKLPSSINYLGDCAFYENNISNATLPEGIEYIGSSVFYENNLRTITIPESTTIIHWSAFNQNNLDTVIFAGDPKIQYIGSGYANLDSLIIPESSSSEFQGWISHDGNMLEKNTNYVIKDFWREYRATGEHTLAFHANGGEGEMDSITNILNIFRLSFGSFSREGYTKMYWATDPNGNNRLEYYYDDFIYIESDLDLYPVWANNSSQLIFHSNGGEGAMDTIKNKISDVVLPINTFTKDGFQFLGWSTSQGGNVEFTDADTVFVKDSMHFYAIWDLTTENIEIQSFKDVQLYPNPTNGLITIESDQVFKLEILTISGQSLSTIKHNGASSTIDISHLTPGVYIFRLSNDNEISVKRIIKE